MAFDRPGVKEAPQEPVPAQAMPAAITHDQVTITYTYDPLGRLKSTVYATGQRFDYTYDPVGNRLSESHALGSTSYTYDIANRLTSVGGVTYSWDNNGNLLSDGVYTYSYDYANRLTTVTQGSTTLSTYVYNGNGDRLSQTVNGLSGAATTHFTLDLNPSTGSGQATGLTQVLDDGENAYLYGRGRIADPTRRPTPPAGNTS